MSLIEKYYIKVLSVMGHIRSIEGLPTRPQKQFWQYDQIWKVRVINSEFISLTDKAKNNLN